MRCAKSLAILAASLVYLAVSAPSLLAGPILLSDNFNSENGGVGQLNYNNFANWNVSKGSVDLIGNGFFDFYPGNGLYVDLDGTTNQAGGITSKTAFTLTPGTYQLQFSIGNNSGEGPGPHSANVSLGGVYSENFTEFGSPPLTTVTRTITVGSSTTANLAFNSLDPPGDSGVIIDNVLLQQISSATAVPEPATAALLGVGLAGLVGAHFRRKYRLGSSVRARNGANR